MLQDIRLAVRGFRRSPVFAAVALVSLTLAIGATTAMFGLLQALVLRELPVRDPGQLLQVSSIAPGASSESGLTFSMYRALQSRQSVFSGVIAWSGNSVQNLAVDRQETHGAVWYVGGNFYSELGVPALRGRLLDANDVAEDTLTPQRVAVISHAFWQRAFGGSNAVIGGTVRIEDEPFMIVGVTPRGFTGIGLTIEPDVTLPLTTLPIISSHRSPAGLSSSGSFWVRVTGRLKPGVTISQARAAIDAIWPGLLADTVPAAYAGPQRDRFLRTRLSVTSAATGYEPALRARFTKPLVIVLGIALLVLLLACVNLASLMLARAATRAHETRVRLALGASRWRVARQVLIEGLLLAAIGAVGGVWFASFTTDALVRRIFADYTIAASLNVRPDARLLLATAMLAGIAGLLCSIVPAWRVARQEGSPLLQGSPRTATPIGRTGRVLVAVQIALSLVLLANASLLVRTLLEIRAVDAGMRTENVLIAFPGPRPGGYRGVDNDTYYPRVLERLAAVPGVSRAAISLFKPAGGGIGGGEPVSPTSATPERSGPISLFTAISPGFFEALGIPLQRGRDLTFGDNSHSARVAMLSATLARQLFPAGDAIGQHVRVGVQPRRQDLEVVGIVADARVYDLKDPNLAAVYVPALQEPDVDYKCFVLRGTGISIRDLNQALDTFGHEHVGNALTLAHITEGVLLQERLAAAIAGFFGVLALLLGAIGLYGLIAYDVTHRRREIGIRIALGARPGLVVRAILRDGLTITTIGLTIGVAGAYATARLVASLLFGISPHDPTTLATAVLILTSVAILACLLPARRAARIDPMIAMRQE